MQLSLKPIIFPHFFVPYLEPTSNFKHFEKKDDHHCSLVRKLKTVKDLVRPLFKKHRFTNSFQNQHVKGSQSLVKSA